MLDKILNSVASVCGFAEDAGKIIQDYYQKQNYTVRTKDDKTPVTQADWDAHILIADRLSKFAPYPVISEESHKTEDLVAAEAPFWLVDPLDGTKEFVNRTGDFTVNIALIHQNYPVLGVIFAPLTQELFFASQTKGAFKKATGGPIVPLKTRTLNPKALTVLVSRHKKEEQDTLRQKWPDLTILRLGSAIKYCRIAEASADLYVRRRGTYEWDTAAGQCILEEAGGALVDFNGKRLRYCKPGLKNEELMAYGDRKIHYGDYLY